MLTILYCVQRVAASNTSLSENNNVPKTNIVHVITSTIRSFFQLISSVLKYLFTSLLKVVLGFLLRSELFTVATGNNFMFPITNEKRSNEYRSMAEFVSNKWLTLSEMEEMNEIIYNVSSIVADIVTKFDYQTKEIAELLFDKFDYILSKNPSFHDEYEMVKNATYKNSPTNLTKRMANLTIRPELSEKTTENKVIEWLSHPFILRCFLNKIFLQNNIYLLDASFSADIYDHFLLAKSILALSKQPRISKKVQQIYDEVIFENTEEFNTYMNQWEIENILFKKLKQKFEKYGLITELETMKKYVKENKNSVFDTSYNFFPF
ncbi:hypothetical protein PGB90_003746 [Kerria lacca]